MIATNPRYYILADPSDTGGLVKFLIDNKISWRPDPSVSFTENLMEFAGRLCYESWENEDGSYSNKNITKVREGNLNYLGNVIKQRHGSVLEHGGPLVILFNNVSRVFTHELVRHRVGTAFSQTSGRYVRYDQLKFWVPDCIAENEEAAKIFADTIATIEAAQTKLAEIYNIDSKPFSDKKKLSSAFRRIAPIGLGNNIIMSANHRAMRHIITMRADPAAEEEIQKIFFDLAQDLSKRFPSIYQDLTIQEGRLCFENPKV